MKFIDTDGTQKESFSIGIGRLKVEFRTFDGVLHFRNHKSPWYRLTGVRVEEGFDDEFKVTLTNDGSPNSRTQLPLSGLYEFYEFESMAVNGRFYYKSTSPADMLLISSDTEVTVVPNNPGTLNIYESSGLLNIENRLNRNIDLVIVKLNKKLEL